MADYRQHPDFSQHHVETSSARGLLIAAVVIVLAILVLSAFSGAEVTVSPDGSAPAAADTATN